MKKNICALLVFVFVVGLSFCKPEKTPTSLSVKKYSEVKESPKQSQGEEKYVLPDVRWKVQEFLGLEFGMSSKEAEQIFFEHNWSVTKRKESILFGNSNLFLQLSGQGELFFGITVTHVSLTFFNEHLYILELSCDEDAVDDAMYAEFLETFVSSYDLKVSKLKGNGHFGKIYESDILETNVGNLSIARSGKPTHHMFYCCLQYKPLLDAVKTFFITHDGE